MRESSRLTGCHRDGFVQIPFHAARDGSGDSAAGRDESNRFPLTRPRRPAAGIASTRDRQSDGPKRQAGRRATAATTD